MKKFEVPDFYRSPIISKIKEKRRLEDPRKKDFSPSLIDFGNVRVLIARHFGFCYGVENAIEIAYKAIEENRGKRIFLLSEMIHNPIVNQDLLSYGIQFIQDTKGNQLISWEELHQDDIVIIPAFGTTVDIERILHERGVAIQRYNTTCPFVEKVWNRSEKLGSNGHTIIIHGTHQHEETRATFSRSSQHGPVLVLRNIQEAHFLGEYILGRVSEDQFLVFFEGRYTKNFSPTNDLQKIGVINQTTMLATETQQITDYLRDVMLQKFGEATIKEHIADTRDTLCYATNDNQSATLNLLNKTADFAIVIGGFNSSNTSHLVELLETKFTTYFIQSTNEIDQKEGIHSYDIHHKRSNYYPSFIPQKEVVTFIITSGASCPDSLVDEVIQHILAIRQPSISIQQAVENFSC
jgi:4-hydroxy-3-methylbut-2-enyl diphosphate reductase